MRPPNLNAYYADLILDTLKRYGVQMICLSPGSRSAPLAIAAHRSGIPLKVCIDERAGGYYATGFSRATGRPVALICTSGTAGANYLPAVVAAFHSRLPVITITADRPVELQNCGANQTIDQTDLFGRFVHATVTLEAPESDADLTSYLDKLHYTMHKSYLGPVHTNVRFREPLAPVPQDYDYDRLQKRRREWYEADSIRIDESADGVAPQNLNRAVEVIKAASRGLIVVGPQQSWARSDAIAKLAERTGWPLLADILSQERLERNLSPNAIGTYDLILGDDATTPILKPELIVHVGGVPTSKRLNSFLESCRGIPYLKFQRDTGTIDPDKLETMRVIGDVSVLLETIAMELTIRDDRAFLRRWQALDTLCSNVLSEHFANGSLSEPAVTSSLSAEIRDGEAIFLSNSMPVRDADSFILTAAKDVLIGCNRGVSGIDGVIASACGFGAGSNRPTTLVIGDLAFLHDFNSLKLAAESPVPIRIILVNNNGGGIFSFLPISDFPETFEPYFGTPHNLDFAKSAAQFDLPHYLPRTITEFRATYADLRHKNRSGVIEVTTNRTDNVTHHAAIRDAVRGRIRKGLADGAFD